MALISACKFTNKIPTTNNLARKMITGEQIKRKIIRDMRVDLTEEFDKNFERKAFFSEKWKPRAKDYRRGSLLEVSTKLRKGIRSETTPDGVRFSAAVPYASIHNEGGTGYQTVRQHTRKNKKTNKTYTVRSHQRRFTMPKRQFIGDSPRTREIIQQVVNDNMAEFAKQLEQSIRQ